MYGSISNLCDVSHDVNVKVHFVALNVQLQIFNLVSLIIDRLGEKIVPCVEKILAFLPQVSQQLTMILLFVHSNHALVFVLIYRVSLFSFKIMEIPFQNGKGLSERVCLFVYNTDFAAPCLLVIILLCKCGYLTLVLSMI